MQLLLHRSFLRPLRPEDAASLARHTDSPAIWRNLGLRPVPNPLADAEAFIVANADEEPTRTFAIEVDQQAVGVIGLRIRGSMELWYWIGEAYWGRGIATEAVQAVTAYAFGTLDINRVEASASSLNIASQRVLVKAGYVLDATLRGWRTTDGVTEDRLTYAMVRG